MQFKRDTDYALRILFGLAESLAEGEDGRQEASADRGDAKTDAPDGGSDVRKGSPAGSSVAKTGIPSGGGGMKAGIPTSSIAAKTGIPKPSFERICGYLEQHGIIYQELSSRGELRMYPGEGFWDQNLLQIVDAVEGGSQLFAVFDRRSQLFRQCGGEMEAIQAEFEKILSHSDIKSIFFSK